MIKLSKTLHLFLILILVNLSVVAKNQGSKMIRHSFACTDYTQGKVFIISEHGRPFKTQSTNRIGAGITVVPLYHPAATLHQPNLLSALKEDFVKLHDFLTSPPPEVKPIQKENLPSSHTSASLKGEQEGKKEKQMDLF